MSFKFTKSNLNFDVYTVASKPTAPGANNDIAIITSVPMPNWIMSPDKPSGIPRSDGNVWIQYSVSGNTFNALKQNTMMIATIKAWQYVDGAWADVTAVSCQNGEWVNWWNGELLNGSNQCEAITGGWVQDATLTIGTFPNTGAVTFDDDGITLSSTNSAYSVVRTKNAIDMSNFSKLIISAKAITTVSNISVRIFILTGASGDVESLDVASIQNMTSTVFADYELPLNLDGKYYLALAVSSSRSGTVKKILLS